MIAKYSYLETIFKFLAHKIKSYWVDTRIHGCQVNTDVIHKQQEAGGREKSVEGLEQHILKSASWHLSLA